MSKKVVIATGRHLAGNPRALKEADALTVAGFEVVVVGGAFAPGIRSEDERLAAAKSWSYVCAFDVTGPGAQSLVLKLQRRVGLELWKRLGVANTWQLNYGAVRLQQCVEALRPDLVIAHWEPALPAALNVMRKGGRAGVDMEDWFSEDLLPEARRTRPLNMLSAMEGRLLQKGLHSTCTSEAMADALVQRHGCRRPVVVRNVFPAADRKGIDCERRDRPNTSVAINSPTVRRPDSWPVSIHWFSQTIGPGRGIEELFAAAACLRGSFEVHFRGDLRGYREWFEQLVQKHGLTKVVKVHAPVGPDQLLSRISEHDVGYCGEPREPANKNLTISNKFFQYLQGGLAVVATDTAGQREAASEAPGAVSLVKAGDVDGLRGVLQQLIDNRDKLHAMRAAAWEAGGRLCWENEAPKLVEAVEKALDRRSRD